MQTTGIMVVTERQHHRPTFIDDLIEVLGPPSPDFCVDVAGGQRQQIWGWGHAGRVFSVSIRNHSGQFDHYTTIVRGRGELTLESVRYPTYAQLRDMCRVVGFPEGTEPQVNAPEETQKNTLDVTPQT